MWEKTLNVLTLVIAIMVAMLLFSSGVQWLFELSIDESLKSLRSQLAVVLMALSALLIILQFGVTRHPFYEYWITSVLGLIIGVVYYN